MNMGRFYTRTSLQVQVLFRNFLISAHFVLELSVKVLMSIKLANSEQLLVVDEDSFMWFSAC